MSGRHATAGGVGAIDGLGFLGAPVHSIQTATGFLDGFVGVIKPIPSPGFLIYGLFQHVGA